MTTTLSTAPTSAAAAAPLPAPRMSGKRPFSEMDDASQALVETTGLDAMPGLDMSSVSTLCHQLMKKKRVMVTAASPGGEQSPFGRGSDEESIEQFQQASLNNELKQDNEELTEEEIQRRKAQRRREQVRAASRRCRDRQRRETEELRMKVFQLEEFISHTMQSYEGEIARLRQQIDMLRQQNASLQLNLMATDRTPPASSPQMCVQSPLPAQSMPTPPLAAPQMYGPPKHESPQDQLAWALGDQSNVAWNPTMIQNLHHSVTAATQTLIAIKQSNAPIAISRQAFGWNLDFWIDGMYYYARTRKFFPGMQAIDIAHRCHNIDYKKYLESFPEVKDAKTLKVIDPTIKIVQMTKQFPGKPLQESVNANFLVHDEHVGGERWVAGVLSIGTQQQLELSSSPEDQCNGYVIEDVTEMMADGQQLRGCLVQGTGRYEGKGKDLNLLMDKLASTFAFVVIRWESFFINDYVMHEEDFNVLEL